MRQPIALAPAIVLVLALGACASQPPGGPGGPGGGRGGPGGGGDGFSRATRLLDEGMYAQALDGFRCLASQGAGYEIAQYFAGYAALREAEAAETPDLMRATLRVEGFDRLIDAAEAGWPAAQAELATAFAATPGQDALAEAAYWAEIYRHNNREHVYGIDRLDDAVEADIAARLGPDGLDMAQVRASQFTLSPMTASETGPDCSVWLRSGRSGPGGPGQGNRGQGGPGGRGGPGGGRGQGGPGGPG